MIDDGASATAPSQDETKRGSGARGNLTLLGLVGERGVQGRSLSIEGTVGWLARGQWRRRACVWARTSREVEGERGRGGLGWRNVHFGPMQNGFFYIFFSFSVFLLLLLFCIF